MKHNKTSIVQLLHVLYYGIKPVLPWSRWQCMTRGKLGYYFEKDKWARKSISFSCFFFIWKIFPAKFILWLAILLPYFGSLPWKFRRISQRSAIAGCWQKKYGTKSPWWQMSQLLIILSLWCYFHTLKKLFFFSQSFIKYIC